MLPLKSQLHLFTAAAERRYVVAFHDGIPIGDGVIEEITDRLIKIGGISYERAEYSFFALEVREKHLLIKVGGIIFTDWY